MSKRKPQDALGPMTEAELSRHIIAAAKECGWRCYHTFLSIHSPAGFPDLFLVRNGKVLAWELKSDKGKALPAQQEWLDALALVPGIEAKVVRPADLEEAYKILAGVLAEPPSATTDGLIQYKYPIKG